MIFLMLVFGNLAVAGAVFLLISLGLAQTGIGKGGCLLQ